MLQGNLHAGSQIPRRIELDSALSKTQGTQKRHEALKPLYVSQFAASLV